MDSTRSFVHFKRDAASESLIYLIKILVIRHIATTNLLARLSLEDIFINVNEAIKPVNVHDQRQKKRPPRSSWAALGGGVGCLKPLMNFAMGPLVTLYVWPPAF